NLLNEKIVGLLYETNDFFWLNAVHFFRNRSALLIAVERSNPFHILIGQREVEYVNVFANPFWMDGFRNDDRTFLQVPTQNDLGRCFAVFFRQFLDDW